MAAATLSLLPISISRCSSSNILSNKVRDVKGRVQVLALIAGADSGDVVNKKNSSWGPVFDVDDPRGRFAEMDMKFSPLEKVALDIRYCDWRARQDLLSIMLLHQKVVEMLNPVASEFKSVATMKKELREMQEELEQAQQQIRISEIRVATTMDKLAHVESLANDRGLREGDASELITQIAPSVKPRKCVNVSGPARKCHPSLKNFWYPVAFSQDVKDDTAMPIECFEEPWVIFRGADGRPGCIQDTCPHRACPLHLGTVKEGQIQCPYHGWEFSNDGKCQKMPSTRKLDVLVRSIPCFEHEGMVWIWPGDAAPAASIPSLLPPPGFKIHAEIVMELPVEHGLLIDNLLDLAHAPFTHTSTFAKGWTVPSTVKFLTPTLGLQGHWDPYPINMEFRPPCMVQSVIGISKPGKLEGKFTQECATHLHQLHVCLPSSRQKTRLLYRMSLDFAPLIRNIPFMSIIWRHLAERVLNEDLRLVLGQQERMNSGVNVWNWPAPYDKLGVRYRLWREALEQGAKQRFMK